MKYCIAFVLLLGVSLQTSAKDDEEQMARNLMSCAEQEGLSKDAVKEIASTGKRPEYSVMKCFDKCMMEKVGAVGPDGKVNEAPLIGLCLIKYPKMDESKCAKLLKECAFVDKHDKCLMCYEAVTCWDNKIKQMTS
ncbi:hypothetical protein PPYR_13228 [Photinus pyralis]|uniref:Uncharacterized protein n=2 Tax=Photinus pyralis TaxID=7054 RepID=A0A5N4A8H9_PHOPY|nr:uncharacterized protein LOC116179763 [Photinus pyralis]XP_031355460.1 uncharacterized protein LOC116179769 [Photinus pyralis]KAB0793599.1 hypothetical protein PPYR_13219 [Photinus pyralis]KAB0793608.1 hypothetical protein PPYR_13228 [Photinus pyralis]